MEKVLLVDDEPGVLAALARELRTGPWEIITCESPAQALHEIDRQPLALVLADYRMPGINGVELLEYCRLRRPATMRIIMSGYSERDILLEAINRASVFRYLCKPWNSEELLDSVVRAVDAYLSQRSDPAPSGTAEAAASKPAVPSQASSSELLRLARDESNAILLSDGSD